MPDSELKSTKKSKFRPRDTVTSWRLYVPLIFGKVTSLQSSMLIPSNNWSRRTIDIWMTPLSGADALSTACATSSTSVTSPRMSCTVQPMLSTSLVKSASCCPLPALRDRKIRCFAPCSTIHTETARPNPPSPPMRRYEESPSSLVWTFFMAFTSRTRAFPDESRSSSTILPICLPCCMYRNASSTAGASNVRSTLIGWKWPWAKQSMVYFSILLLISGRSCLICSTSKQQ
ncbi:unnamed protein product [Periconia digitata]|uniref:Uncharacterized protein n=1 Tax=Periconia digitata TaxID=1303443 RepID=A0A9W4XY03_9PLEO|nr:unnamed protein product [Periconia digitata]